MKLFTCGTEVILKRPGVQGNITAIEIRFDLVRYEVTYYIEGVQQRVMCTEGEFYIDAEEKRMTVGFK